jgi:hypothetical protein
MAKKDEYSAGGQLNLFPTNPAIGNMSLTSIKLKGGVVEMDMLATTEATSLDQLTPQVQAKAHIAHAVRLMGGKVWGLEVLLSEACGEHWAEVQAREADSQIGYARTDGAPRYDVRFEGVQDQRDAGEIGEVAAEAAGAGGEQPDPETDETLDGSGVDGGEQPAADSGGSTADNVVDYAEIRKATKRATAGLSGVDGTH